MNLAFRKFANVVLAVVVLSGTLIGYKHWQNRNLLKLCHEDPIASFDGSLTEGHGPASARIYACEKQSTSTELTDVRQNLIEVTVRKQTLLFSWSDRFFARVALIADIDGDGRKEFIFQGEPWDYRVVSLANGHFDFKKPVDQLATRGLPGEPRDLNGDGRTEFFAFREFPKDFVGGANAATKTTMVPRVFQWSSKSGFRDVSQQFGMYYVDEVIPGLQQRMQNEADPVQRDLIKDAIDYIGSHYVTESNSRAFAEANK